MLKSKYLTISSNFGLLISSYRNLLFYILVILFLLFLLFLSDIVETIASSMSVYLKLDDGVLIDVNVPGGDGVFPELTGDEDHGRFIVFPASTHTQTLGLIRGQSKK